MYLQIRRPKSTGETRVERSLAFGDELHPRMSLGSIGYQSSVYSALAHFLLLSALPTVRVTQNKFDMVLNRGPKSGAIDLSVLNETNGAAGQVKQEVAEDLDGRFGRWKRRQAQTVGVERHTRRA